MHHKKLHLCLFLLFHLSYGKIIVFKRDPIKLFETQYGIINKYNMNEHTPYSGLTSDITSLDPTKFNLFII